MKQETKRSLLDALEAILKDAVNDGYEVEDGYELTASSEGIENMLSDIIEYKATIHAMISTCDEFIRNICEVHVDTEELLDHVEAFEFFIEHMKDINGYEEE